MFYLAIADHLHLRTLHPDDAGVLFRLIELNRARLQPWIHPSSLPKTAEATRDFTIECFLNSLNPMEAAAKYPQYVQELEEYFPLPDPPMEMGIWWNGSLAGELMLSRLQESYIAAEFGYWIAEEAEGRGLVTRCVSALMDYAIGEMGVERFVIGCAVDNLRSRAIPERLGYRLQATVPDGEVVGDFVYDRVIYGIRSTAWRERKKVLLST
ncbi:MAG: GNAT family N-acetyltransferase [Bacteroidota bacterium]|jgi:ribosomal-protein-serine acetyltransferase